MPEWWGMTDFIENDVNPWFDYANTCGPCTQKSPVPSVTQQIFITIDIVGGSYEWDGFVDENGAACGEGTATDPVKLFKLKGTFWKNQPYGFVEH